MTTPFLARSILPVLASVGLIAGAAVVHGAWTGRWGSDNSMEGAGPLLQRVPMRIGEWEGKNFELPARHLLVGNITGYLAREYTHAPTGRKATVLIVYGRPGAIGAHPPDVCYRGAGFKTTTAPARVEPNWAGEGSEFGSMRAVKDGVTREALSVHWAWSKDLARWETPARPVLHFAFALPLYKIYLVRPVSPDPKADSDDDRTAADSLYAGVLRALK